MAHGCSQRGADHRSLLRAPPRGPRGPCDLCANCGGSGHQAQMIANRGYTHTYTYIYICIHICLYVYVYIYICICMYMYVYLCICICIYIYIYTYVPCKYSHLLVLNSLDTSSGLGFFTYTCVYYLKLVCELYFSNSLEPMAEESTSKQIS